MGPCDGQRAEDAQVHHKALNLHYVVRLRGVSICCQGEMLYMHSMPSYKETLQ